MDFYIDKAGNYYEGDRIARVGKQDTKVPKRPSPDYTWVNDEWIIDNSKVLVRKILEIGGTDMHMARICEDLIDLLIVKGVFAMEDLPKDVREKIKVRKDLRIEIAALKQ